MKFLKASTLNIKACNNIIRGYMILEYIMVNIVINLLEIIYTLTQMQT